VTEVLQTWTTRAPAFAEMIRQIQAHEAPFAVIPHPVGFIRRGDIFFLQFLFHPGSTLGGYDNSGSYGMHLFFAPIVFTLAYRMVLPVWRPE
jgi:hypothetical protein